MLQINKLTDYSVHILSALSKHKHEYLSAAQLSELIALPAATVGKCLKLLLSASLLQSTRGSKGGYHLHCKLSEISLLDVMQAIEGEIALIKCITSDGGCCDLQPQCSFRANWKSVNSHMIKLLEHFSIEDMIAPSGLRYDIPVDLITASNSSVVIEKEG